MPGKKESRIKGSDVKSFKKFQQALKPIKKVNQKNK